ncbi:MAG: hypothetical protein ACNA8H_08845, partial [Anaerolineales bacterium]
MVEIEKMRSLLLMILGLLYFSVVTVQAASVVEAVKVEPLPFDITTDIRVEPVLISEAPNVTLEYRWFVNGNEILHEITEIFPGSLLRRGDELSIEIIPVTASGERLQSFVSEALVVGNTSPEIISEPPPTLTEQGFSYLVQATDPDADPLT